MSWTFTRHETPQRLADIMRRAWRLVRTAAVSFAVALRAAWAEARAAAGQPLPTPRTLVSYLVKIGGLRPCGELRQIGAPLCVLRRAGEGLDVAARLATDAGYEIGECVDRLLSCIRDEAFGHRHFARADLADALDLDAWRDHHAAIMTDPPAAEIPF